MQLPLEVVRQPPVVIEPRQVRTAHVTHLQLLMPARPTRITQRLQLTMPLDQRRPGLGDVRMVVHQRLADSAQLGQRLDLEQASVDGAPQLSDLPQQRVRLADLVGRLLQPPLGGIDPPVALVDVPF